jgi:hypothetical protein
MQKLRRQYVDAQGGIIFDPLHNRDFSYGLGPPTNGVLGYNPGSLYIDETNALVYYNAGTLASSLWTQFIGTGTTASVAVLPPTNVIPPATTTFTATQANASGRVVQVAPTAGLAITLPAATGSGNNYEFDVTATVAGGNLTIDAKPGGAVYSGYASQNKPGTGLTTTATAANTNLLTFNGTTSGGIAGDVIELIDSAVNVWSLFINGQYSGVFATPFSNH